MKRGKGSTFERWFCKRLSLWWTDGKDDNVFWRTAGSGGRATNRFKRGQKTAGGYGDIAAVNHIGQPFLDFFTVELKRGYSKHHVTDLVDKGKAPHTQWEKFVLQAMDSAEQAGSTAWMIVNQRDRREVMCWFPMSTYIYLREMGAGDLGGVHFVIASTFVRRPGKKLNRMVHLFGCPMEQFWEVVRPEMLR